MNRHKPKLKIGDVGEIYGVKLTITGHIKYAQRQEGENYYWEDWSATGSDGNQYWIDYDHYSKQYTFFKQMEFDSDSFLSQQANRLPSYDGDKIEMVEAGTAKVLSVTGTLPFTINKAETVEFFDGVGGQGLYSLEWDYRLARLYLGQNINYANLHEAFGYHKEAQASRAREKRRIRWFMVDLTMLFVMFAAIGGLLLMEPTKTTIISTDIKACTYNQTSCKNPTTIEPINFGLLPAVYKITVVTPLSNDPNGLVSQWESVVVELLDQNDKPQNGFQLDYIYGNSNTNSAIFRVTNPGEYKLGFTVHAPSTTTQTTTTNTTNLRPTTPNTTTTNGITAPTSGTTTKPTTADLTHNMDITVESIFLTVEPLLALLGTSVLYLFTRAGGWKIFAEF